MKQLPWLAAAFALLATCSTDDQFLCEEAAARLADCCVGFNPKMLNCEDAGVTGGGCRPIDPHAVRQEEARCILGVDCGALSSVCARVTSRAACVGPICQVDIDCSQTCPLFGTTPCRDHCVLGRCACGPDAGDACNEQAGGEPPCPAAASPVCP